MTKPAFPDQFSLFWNVYPRRNGKRLGKQATRERFEKLSKEDQVLCVQAAIAYSRDEQVHRGYARDPERFLKNGWWRDWIGPASQQCATTGCEDLAEPGCSRCRPHLIRFIKAWQARDEYGLAHPNVPPPTTEEKKYVESTDRDEASTRTPHAGAQG